MGGELKLRSKVGVGSAFYFDTEFPVADRNLVVEESAVANNCAFSSLAPLRILVAEDNVVNQKLLLRMMERAGHRVALACDGSEAVELYRHSDFDLVLMDIQMPNKGGVEAAAEIRSIDRESRRGKVPIIALTAHALEGDREKFLALGMDEYLPKPIDRQELFRVLASFSAAARNMEKI